MEPNFNLGDKVSLSYSKEVGHIVGCADYTNSPTLYYVRYLSGDGRQVEAWWAADALQPLG